MEKRPDSGIKISIFAIIVSIFGIALTLIKEISLETLILLTVLTTSAIVLAILSFYVSRTNKNYEDINKIKDKFITNERLNKLELIVFKK